MDPLNHMCDALVSINNLLQKRREMMGESDITALEKVDAMVSTELNRNENHSNENFQIGNRSIEELPNINEHDIQRLKSINVDTMQDLLGRYLIHDTPEEFYSFLIKTSRLSANTATMITQLLYQWTRHHLDGINDDQNINRMNSLDI